VLLGDSIDRKSLERGMSAYLYSSSFELYTKEKVLDKFKSQTSF